MVDLVDDLEVARQDGAEQIDRPLLERLGHHRVIRVAEARLGQLPRLLPLDQLDVDEQSHQLGDRDRRVRVVELDRDLVGEHVERVVRLLVAPDDVLERRGDEEVLLLEPQLLARHAVVVRVEHLRDRLGRVLRANGRDVVALVELAEVELPRRARRPEPEGVDVVGPEAGDGRVERHRHDLGRVDPLVDDPSAPVGVLDHAAVELHRIERLRATDLPRVAEAQPVVRLLDLVTASDPLMEDPVFVADAVAVARQLERRHRVEEAGGEPAETAVAETGVPLDLADLVEVDLERLERMPQLLREVEVHERVAECPPDQELHREVVDPLRVRLVVGVLSLHPPLDEPVADRERRREEPVEVGRGELVLGEREFEVILKGPLQGLRVHAVVVVGFYRRHNQPPQT